MSTLSNVNIRRDENNSPCTKLALDAFPEAISSQTGVSVKYVPSSGKKWFVFRASYGREDKASDILVENGTYTYVAKRVVDKQVDGKRKKILENLLPNLLFAYTTEAKANEYIKFTPELSFLTYYYNHFITKDDLTNPPLIIPTNEMENFIRATKSQNEHIMYVDPAKCRFKGGETVKVCDGLFKGVIGKVARVSGQQRVVLSLSKIGLISTAYIPTAFIEKLR